MPQSVSAMMPAGSINSLPRSQTPVSMPRSMSTTHCRADTPVDRPGLAQAASFPSQRPPSPYTPMQPATATFGTQQSEASALVPTAQSVQPHAALEPTQSVASDVPARTQEKSWHGNIHHTVHRNVMHEVDKQVNDCKTQ
eukprot:gnl/MRDRNA2_/MRDRNA2_23340_c0_seq1.p1 gnl/MRDRNA2_/MRDRNA2_23340_c0~~gnl/MRDRNA2_/MRDRNA2_23340_c0_seq1.p1  ORF type:complete len:140 (+),score=21.73 gnl/MRDRNA2_/MRDRNA2_23340_c0_seq1:71-490(+)